MPLIPSTMNSNSGSSDLSDWTNKLMGKKIGEQSDATTFAKTELPEKHRIVKEGDMLSMDHVPERTNVHVGDDGTVRKVTKG